MMKARLFGPLPVLAGSMLGGAVTSALLACWFSGVREAWCPAAALLGAAFGFLGWLLSDSLQDAVVVLIGTGFPGLVILSNVDNKAFCLFTIAFTGGINAGKLIGGIYRDLT